MVPLVVLVHLVLSVSEFTQADSWAGPQRTSFTVARAYTPVRELHDDDAEIPRNLIVAPIFREHVQMMRALSPTFRQQCIRLAHEPRLTVVLGSDSAAVPTETRASTKITRERNGGLRAVVRIKQREHVTELIAHEIEHVIEQLDGVDLKRMAAMNASGVHQCRCAETDSFETVRAVLAGEQVAREVSERTR
jgi:hypothetical protein